MKIPLLLVLATLILSALSTPAQTQASNQSPSDDYLPSLLVYEGSRLVPYVDNGRQWTVGIGHRLTGAGIRPPKEHYTTAEVTQFYSEDLESTLAFLRRDEPDFDRLPFGVRLTMVHLVWTCGQTGYIGWIKFRAAIRARDYRLAARELFWSRWWTQVGPMRGNYLYDGLMNAAAQNRTH